MKFTIYLKNVPETITVSTGSLAALLGDKMALREAITERKAKVGSVGAVWPPAYDQHNNRVKGFYPHIVSGRKYARHLVNEIRSAQQKANGHTRTTVRAFANHGMVENIRQDLEAGGLTIEAQFSASNAVNGCDLIYIGANKHERMPDPVILQQEMQSVQSLDTVMPVQYRHARERVRQRGYSVSTLREVTRDDIDALLALYHEAYQRYTFEITDQTITGMLSNGNIVIVGRDQQAGIVSSLIAEHGQLLLEGGKIRLDLYELSDYATLKAHRRNGLITLMQMEAIRAIRSMERGHEAIVYAEDRAAWIAVNVSSKKAGMQYSGTLPKHCVLESDRDFQEQGEYENLNVWVHEPEG